MGILKYAFLANDAISPTALEHRKNVLVDTRKTKKQKEERQFAMK